jgi:hypothetical protein
MHLDFDEDFSNGRVLDVTGNGHDGWQFNPTNWITATNGIFGTTAGHWLINGTQGDYSGHVYPSSQYMGVTDLTGLSPLTNMTISVWLKTDPTAQDIVMFVLDSSYNVDYAMSPSAASNSWTLGRMYHPYFSFSVAKASGTEEILNWPVDTVSTTDLTMTQWHHYAATFDCSNNVAFAYHDGVLCAASALGVPYLAIYGCKWIQWLCIGAAAMDGTPNWGDDLYPNDSYFAGSMDDIRIYNRTLSAAEVQALYRGSTFAQNLAIQTAAPQSIQVRWAGNSNAVYQVEYQTNLTGTAWSPLQSPILGSVTNSIIDSILGQPARFYRVRVLP